jgi:hypothetical protein
MRAESFGTLGFGLHFRLESPEDIDDGLRAVMAEAYAIGVQQHLIKRAGRLTSGST